MYLLITAFIGAPSFHGAPSATSCWPLFSNHRKSLTVYSIRGTAKHLPAVTQSLATLQIGDGVVAVYSEAA